MSQSSSAQREPSMEEILSSIRKIIEDGDTTQSAELLDASKTELAEEEPIASILKRSSVADAAPEVEQFRKELTESETEAGDADQPSADNDSDEPAAVTEPEPDEEPTKAAAVEVAQPEEEASPKQESQPDPDPSEKEQDVFSAETGKRLQSDADKAEDAEPATASADAEAKAEDGKPDSGAVAVPEVAEARPIISETASRKIAASFEQLSEAFAESRKRSFDEMAEEMLRPMLQDWLDNNLPLLVERLVREEIERVARGNAD